MQKLNKTLLGGLLLGALLGLYATTLAQPGPAFERFDQNGDGQVSREEFDAARAERIKQRLSEGGQMRGLASAPAFERMDTNQDGQLSQDEFAAARAARREQRQAMGMGMGQGQGKGRDPRAIVAESVSPADFQTTLNTFRDQLKADGWNLIGEFDLGKRLAKKGVEIPGGLVILKLTSGKNAVPLLKQDATRYISAFMPCGVSVYGMEDGSVRISRMNAGMMARMMEPEVAEVMRKSATKLDASIQATLAKLQG